MYVIRSILAVAALITGSASLYVLRPEMLMPRLLTLLPLLEFFFILLHTPSDRSASFDSKQGKSGKPLAADLQSFL